MEFVGIYTNELLDHVGSPRQDFISHFVEQRQSGGEQLYFSNSAVSLISPPLTFSLRSHGL